MNKVKKAQAYELEIGTNISSTLDSKVKIIYTEGDNFLVFSKVKLEDWLERVYFFIWPLYEENIASHLECLTFIFY